LILSFLSAAVGGYACAWIAPGPRAVHVGVLAGLLAVMSLASAASTGAAPGQPAWYPWVIGAIGVAGIVVGGGIRLGPRRSPA
jgi:hypothetical protein